ncbi:MAG: winged helix-turn-helix domain-containing protein [Nanoarchaeota archaeon]|nr:winged helix-turn-helix domain-containing protein [Nanoarchaeota archaeon]
MQGLTNNELRVIDFLIRNFNERININGIAKRLNLSPRGAYKILKKLERIKIILPEGIGNGIFYKMNYDDELAKKVSAFVLTQKDMNKYALIQAENLKVVKKYVLCCALFGSIVHNGEKANDIDVMLVFQKENYKKIYKEIDMLNSMSLKRIHKLVQTPKDLANNIKKGDKVVLDIIKKGQFLWGAEIIVEAIKNGSR